VTKEAECARRHKIRACVCVCVCVGRIHWYATVSVGGCVKCVEKSNCHLGRSSAEQKNSLCASQLDLRFVLNSLCSGAPDMAREWYDMIWYMIWYGIWYGTIWYMIYVSIRYGMIWYYMIYDMIYYIILYYIILYYIILYYIILYYIILYYIILYYIILYMIRYDVIW